MSKEAAVPRFGPEHWVTMRATGEHVKVESWSRIAVAYRVRSQKHGLQFASEAELEELSVHPDLHLGKHWSRCPAPRCGAPLTPELALCPQCHAPTCTCGRCQCARVAAKPAGAKRARARTVQKKASANGA